MAERIAVASDHGAVEMKEAVLSWLAAAGCEPVDMGCAPGESVDYPDYAALVATAVADGEVSRGILLCGTGIGMSIAANKVEGIRAALVHDHYTAKMSREHNDSNVLVLGGRTTGIEVAREIVATWLATPFGGGRHQRRLDKIADLERR